MSIVTELISNPVFAGVVGGAGVSTIMWKCQQVPMSLFYAARAQLTTYIEIDNSDDMFDRLLVYLSNLPHVKKARWLRMTEHYDEEQQKWIWRTTFGAGWHVFQDHGKRFLLHRQIEDADKGGMTLQRRETITVRTFGRDQTAICELMKRAEDVYKTCPSIRVYIWHQGHYLLVDRKPLRSLDTVYIPLEQKNRVISDVQKFIDNKEDYVKKGIPYKRGYLFKGPPGTGKTTLAFAVASYLKRPLYIINLNTAGGDTGIAAAFNFIESGAIVLIEDVDANDITHTRDKKPANDNNAAPDPGKQITLSGLLNAIDGVGARDNRILIMTSNHADKLDAALIRPGRVDVVEEVGYLDRPEAVNMATAFGRDEMWVNDNVKLPVSPAHLQNMLIKESA